MADSSRPTGVDIEQSEWCRDILLGFRDGHQGSFASVVVRVQHYEPWRQANDSCPELPGAEIVSDADTPTLERKAAYQPAILQELRQIGPLKASQPETDIRQFRGRAPGLGCAVAMSLRLARSREVSSARVSKTSKGSTYWKSWQFLCTPPGRRSRMPA